MNACGTYLGRVDSAMLVRQSMPISPISDPSRPNTSDDCGSGTICHTSDGVGPSRGAQAMSSASCARDTDAASRSPPASAKTRPAARPARMSEFTMRFSLKYPIGARQLPGAPRPAMLIPDMTRSVHLAVAQFRPRKGDYAGNLARLGPLFAQVDAQQPRPHVLCLPESALTGYFLEGGVREHAVTAGTMAADLQAAYRAAVPGDSTLDVMLGFYELWSGKLYNSALYVTLGGAEPVIRHVHRKMFLPTYGLFDEERFVERGRDIRAFDTPWGRAAMLICEDAWHSLTATVAALDGAQVLFIPSAPPARGPWRDGETSGVPSSVSRWERLARDMADEHGAFVVLAALSGSEGGRLFPGASLVAGPKGEVRVRGPLWTEALVVHTLDFADVARARADQPLLADLEVMAPHLRASMERVERHEPSALVYDAAPPRGSEPRPAGAPVAAVTDLVVVNGDAVERPPVPIDIDPELTANWLVAFLRDEIEQRGYRKAVVGVSGGVDSAVTAYLAARALGPERVIGVRMPYRTSSPQSGIDGQRVIDALGIEGRTRGHQRRGGRLPPDGPRRRRYPARQRDGAHAHDRAVRHLGPRRRDPAGHGEQDGADVRLFHLARRRRPAGESAGRPVQDAGVGAGPLPGGAGRDREQGAHGGPRRGPDGRGRFRHQLPEGRPDPQLAARRLHRG